MADDGKKISFGFSKSIKKTALKVIPPLEQKKVDFIECLDEKAIKVIGGEEKKDEPLVIPMLGSKTWHDRIINKIDADVFEPKTKPVENGTVPQINIKQEPTDEVLNSDVPMPDTVVPSIEPTAQVKMETGDVHSESPKTLEEQAAQEIIEDLKSKDTKVEKPNVLTVSVGESQSLKGQAESTLEDYEQIPIDAFGLAMLRGMGWHPDKGIGKNERVVSAALPELRPKGMGLGADKVTLQKQNGTPKTKEEEDLKLVKGAFVKIIAGKQSNNYGQIEGLDDDAGRLIVKMALGENTLSVNEFMVQPVTKAEYSKNAKVLNATKYEEYKNKEETSKVIQVSSDDENDKKTEKLDNKRERKKEKLKKHERSTDTESSTERKSRKRKSNDNSEEEKEKKSKKSKKSKKHKRQDSSCERSSRKNRKKDKEREKRKDKRTGYSDSLDRRKHKKHKKSRSRSPRK
ncbi:G-patch domain and KOW motifs-containing protein [Cephus cinctus]|uniref:G-patch domain and KOW motifs-containing protein n=1 Tax=Cephus cinctus TaxID=211228 RepID=A0AAJ7BLW4_CEPCN|nr:G-patch domain and KOW motifs-containing protein [Cephus cinctus]